MAQQGGARHALLLGRTRVHVAPDPSLLRGAHAALCGAPGPTESLRRGVRARV